MEDLNNISIYTKPTSISIRTLLILMQKTTFRKRASPARVFKYTRIIFLNSNLDFYFYNTDTVFC